MLPANSSTLIIPDHGFISRNIKLGLIPIVFLCILALAKLIQIKDVGGDSFQLSVCFSALFIITIFYWHYTLKHYPTPLHLPFIWAILLFLEFVISPTYDILFDVYPLTDTTFYANMIRASIACILFTTGSLTAIAISKKYANKNTLRNLSLSIVFSRVEQSVYIFLFAAPIVSLIAGLYILRTAGVIHGSLDYARGEGLIGTSIFAPLLRLADVGSLVGSWLSLTASTKQVKRRFLIFSFVNLIVALVVPTVLEQRFGILQSILYFIFPYLARLRWFNKNRAKLLFTALPSFLAIIFVFNSLTTSLRQFKMNKNTIEIHEVLEVARTQEESHFRHMKLLSDLIKNGIDEPNFGGLYSGTPIVGDLLIFLPRKLFPEKPTTTLEVINGGAQGRIFRAQDRGNYSINTGSLWIQLYMLGGIVGMLPITLVVSFIFINTWGQCYTKGTFLHYFIIATGLWFVFGWLSFNVAFTTIELPGILFGALIVRLFLKFNNIKGIEAV